MKSENEVLVSKQKDLFSFRDLADGTITTYISYLIQFIEWVETELAKPVRDVTWAEIRSYVNPGTTVRSGIVRSTSISPSSIISGIMS